MSRKIKKLEVSAEVRQLLEKEYKSGATPVVSRRCQMVLLKLQGYRFREIATIVDSCEMSVNKWINRFSTAGMEGLKTKEGQGRKPILTAAHLAVVRAAIEAERQRLSQARLIIEASSGKPMSSSALRRFLKVITAVTSE